ncbi:MAG: DUF1127 domain-containing protein [Rhizobiales bacterium]|nr:DUF1127 domain-containing protein [Hyphomicrobiales bacterium]
MNYTQTATSHSRIDFDLKPRPTQAAARPKQTRLEKIIATFVTWQNRETQRRHLHNLDDRLLADMGITRADAEHESRKPFWRA